MPRRLGENSPDNEVGAINEEAEKFELLNYNHPPGPG